jgi:hypothetical protein
LNALKWLLTNPLEKRTTFCLFYFLIIIFHIVIVMFVIFLYERDCKYLIMSSFLYLRTRFAPIRMAGSVPFRSHSRSVFGWTLSKSHASCKVRSSGTCSSGGCLLFWLDIMVLLIFYLPFDNIIIQQRAHFRKKVCCG